MKLQLEFVTDPKRSHKHLDGPLRCNDLRSLGKTLCAAKIWAEERQVCKLPTT